MGIFGNRNRSDKPAVDVPKPPRYWQPTEHRRNCDRIVYLESHRPTSLRVQGALEHCLDPADDRDPGPTVAVPDPFTGGEWISLPIWGVIVVLFVVTVGGWTWMILWRFAQ